MFGIFRKKKSVEKLNRNLNFAFSKLDNDISNMQAWVNHLKERNENIEYSHSSHVDLTRRDLDSLSKWMRYLYNHSMQLHNRFRDMSSYIKNLEKNHNALQERLAEVEKRVEGHERTLEDNRKGHGGPDSNNFQGQVRDKSGTSRGQVEDMSSKSEDIDEEGDNAPDLSPKKAFKVNRSALTGSQLEFLNLLYHADRPLSYEEISNMLGKKSKSVRNLIYGLRSKGLEIKNKYVGLRKKGFYIDKKEKLKLTGR
ncbi:MAG: hypothetical protein ACQEP1_02150 [Nanobdellota archaeon]